MKNILLKPFLVCTAFFLAGAIMWCGSGLAMAASESQAVPNTINYQGTLRDVQGNLVNGTRTMTFKIYDGPALSPPSVSLFHTETIADVVVVDGLFNVVLGETVTLNADIFKGDTRYIGITVAPDSQEMIPRQRIHAVPWARQATHALNAGTADSAKALSDGATVGSIAGDLSTQGDLLANGSLAVEQGDSQWRIHPFVDGNLNKLGIYRVDQSQSNPSEELMMSVWDVDGGANALQVQALLVSDGMAVQRSLIVDQDITAQGTVTAVGGFNGRCRNSFNGGGGVCDQDVAETFATDELTEAGELVVLLPEDRDIAAVTLSQRGYETGLIGVVSTKPGLVFDQGETLLAADTSNLISENKTVVAMIGRVPTKFTLENGPISVGDPLTSSSTPGMAMKATQAGQIVGYAMQSSSEATHGKLLVWLQPGLYMPAAQLDALNALANGDTAASAGVSSGQSGFGTRLDQLFGSSLAAGLPPAGLPLLGGLLLTGTVAGLYSRKRGQG